MNELLARAISLKFYRRRTARHFAAGVLQDATTFADGDDEPQLSSCARPQGPNSAPVRGRPGTCLKAALQLCQHTGGPLRVPDQGRFWLGPPSCERASQKVCLGCSGSALRTGRRLVAGHGFGGSSPSLAGERRAVRFRWYRCAPLTAGTTPTPDGGHARGEQGADAPRAELRWRVCPGRPPGPTSARHRGLAFRRRRSDRRRRPPNTSRDDSSQGNQPMTAQRRTRSRPGASRLSAVRVLVVQLDHRVLSLIGAALAVLILAGLVALRAQGSRCAQGPNSHAAQAFQRRRASGGSTRSPSVTAGPAPPTIALTPAPALTPASQPPARTLNDAEREGQRRERALRAAITPPIAAAAFEARSGMVSGENAERPATCTEGGRLPAGSSRPRRSQGIRLPLLACRRRRARGRRVRGLPLGSPCAGEPLRGQGPDGHPGRAP